MLCTLVQGSLQRTSGVVWVGHGKDILRLGAAGILCSSADWETLRLGTANSGVQQLWIKFRGGAMQAQGRCRNTLRLDTARISARG